MHRLPSVFILIFERMNLRILFLATILFVSLKSTAQYWQQKVDFTIDVTLNDKEKTLNGFEKIIYTNNSHDTLTYIWFHLWPNAYKNDRTAFSNQRLENGSTDFYFANKEQRGYINKLDFKVNGTTARQEDHPQHIDIIKLLLPSPLAPKQQITITTPFHVKLPYNFSRGGFVDESFQITQWYPKPAVYDHKGWHTIPYLDQGEFYNDFGNYDVRITLPKNYVVAATGNLQNDEERSWLKGLKNNEQNIKETKNKTVKPNISIPPSSTELKTIQYKHDNVTDFAWFADKTFLVITDTCQLSSGKVIDVYSFYTVAQQEQWKQSVEQAKDAVRFLSTEVGEYPYSVVSVVQGPESSFSGGMEYPTITLISPVGSSKALDQVIAHEVFHNWFQGILASNERKHPWMDEGITSFYEDKYMRRKYGKQGQGNELLFQSRAFNKTDQPIETRSEEFSAINYGVVAYHKTSEWMHLLELQYGTNTVQEFIKEYYQQWKFKHPYPEDFDAIARKHLTGVDPLLDLRNKKGILPGKELKGFSMINPLKKNSIRNYIDSPIENALVVLPSIGINKYDGIMLGALFTNYKLPPNRFQFLLTPMYATRSKELVGLGRASYTTHWTGFIRKASLFVNGSTFSMDDFKDTAGKAIHFKFSKLAPGIRFVFKEKNPRSTSEKYIQWKTFFINEQSLRITPDTLFNGNDTALIQRYNQPWQKSTIHQLRFAYENNRSLYPFNFKFNIDGTRDFLRPTITINYFFNYSKGGGLNLRLFAGKFLYAGEKTLRKQFENDRYFLNMTGARGYEDYTYSDYFIGRNEFEGFASQQIMIRDGGFKVRTDLLANKIGKTYDWLVAMNLNSSIPDGLNPFRVLPIKIPVKVYADFGTYAEAWKKDSEADRLLFNAGFHLPLLKESFNIYIPIVYNKVYADYFKSTLGKGRCFKTISFSIDLFNKNLKTINRQLEFL